MNSDPPQTGVGGPDLALLRRIADLEAENARGRRERAKFEQLQLVASLNMKLEQMKSEMATARQLDFLRFQHEKDRTRSELNLLRAHQERERTR